MKVILLKDVAKLGKKYDVKTVADGYAINRLIPEGHAETATPKALKRVETIKLRDDAERKIKEDLLLKNLEDLKGVVVKISGKANEKGHLFAGIHKEALVPALKEQTRLDITPEYINLEKPIKEVGEHEVTVKVGGKEATFKVVITALA